MKRLVICADGTWNNPGQTDDGTPCPTNVVRLAQAVAPTGADGVVQVVCYHDGVGTHPGVDRILGGMFGVGLDRNICDLYRFVAQNFEPGDELYLFGFSRGAFTARSLAGMIRKCGVLPKDRIDNVGHAYDFYRDDTKPGSPDADAWRFEHRSVLTRIRCIGVWDTVGALGIPLSPLKFVAQRKYAFHDVELSSWVDNAFHALAIDERRQPFLPSIWKVQQPSPGQPPQNVKQVWFAGVHSDVGGGYSRADLSDIALDWMIEQAAGCGLGFLSDVRQGLSRNPLAEPHDSMTFYYRVLGDGSRSIGLPTETPAAYPATFEEVAPSARERWDAPNLGYRPTPLVKYFAALDAPAEPVAAGGD